LGLSCPEDLFDLDFFQHDPAPFFKFAKALYFPLGNGKRVEPSDSHRFLALLEHQNKLLRVYTQNIDGLEEAAGVSSKRMVYAHGSLRWATCGRCQHRVPAAEIQPDIERGRVPLCRVTAQTTTTTTTSSSASPIARTRISVKRQKRTPTRSTTATTPPRSHYCGGVLKPDITFFGETLGDKVRKSLEADRQKADAVIVIGTSLSVAPMSKVIQYLPPTIPRILINRTVVHAPAHVNEGSDDDDNSDEDEEDFRENYTFDSYLLGFCDDVTRAVVKQIKTKKSSDEGKLLSTLSKDDDVFLVDDWQSTNIPHNRILLFPGAMSTKDDDDLTYTEVAHCDGCEQEIAGAIHKCVQCFDYDLCHACYPKLRKTHCKGKHAFTKEPRR